MHRRKSERRIGTNQKLRLCGQSRSDYIHFALHSVGVSRGSKRCTVWKPASNESKELYLLQLQQKNSKSANPTANIIPKEISSGKSPDNFINESRLLSGVPVNAAKMEPCRIVRLPSSPDSIIAKDIIILLKHFIIYSFSPHLHPLQWAVFIRQPTVTVVCSAVAVLAFFSVV